MGALAGPTGESQRIAGLDVARGFALLGIFLVNIRMMGAPLGEAFEMTPQAEGPLGRALFYLVSIFFQSKSYPLFSMLFGAGLVLMYDRAMAAGRPFAGVYLRRLLGLAGFGAINAFLMWYGDVLLFYAGIALVAMWLAPLRARWLLAIGLAATLLGVLIATGMGAMSLYYAEQMAEQAAEHAAAGAGDPVAVEGAYRALLEAFPKGKVTGPDHPLWMAAEREALGEGPMGAATEMRAINWVSGLLFWQVLMGGGPHILGMFLVGGALLRAGVLQPGAARARRRLALLGLVVGVPMSILASLLPVLAGEESPLIALSIPLVMLFGPLVSLLYLALAFEVAARLPAVAGPLAAAGRTALSNYLLQSLVAAAVFQHWGLGLFGEVPPAGRIGLVVVVFAGQLALSVLWLRWFRMGPLEWLWRWWTYLRRPRLVRDRAAPAPMESGAVG